MTTTDAGVDTTVIPPIQDDETRSAPYGTDRAVLCALLLAVGVVGVIGRIAGMERTGAVGLILFTLIAPGAATLTFARTPGGFPGRLGLSLGVSFTIVTAVSMIEVYTGLWAPTATLGIIGVISAAVLAVALIRDGRHVVRALRAPRQPHDAALARILPVWLGFAVAGFLVCLVGALASREPDPEVGGFLREVNPIWYVGLVLTVVASAMGLLSRGPLARTRSVAAVSSFLLPVVLTLTPTVIYRAPRSQSAEKHIQLSQLIAQTHHLRATETIYNDWPGLFTTSAFLKDFAGITDLISLATWWPMLLVVFRVVGMRLLAGNFVASSRVAWLTATVVFLATPGGLDYYSPQSVGYVLGLVTLWVATTRTLQLRARCVLLLTLTVGIVITHQLTPYILAGAIVMFMLFKQLQKWWLPAIVIVPTLAWTGIHFDQVRRFISPHGVGSSGNFALPSQRGTSNPQLIVHVAIAVTAVGVLIVGLLAAWTFFGNLRKRWAWALALSTFVGFGAVAVNAYGNEGTFRAVFFALPWLGVLAAMKFSESPARRGRLRAVIVAGALGLLVPTCLLGSFLLDGSTVIRQSDREFLLTARAGAVQHPSERTVIATLGDADYPSVQVAKLDNFSVARTRLTQLVDKYPPTRGQFARVLATDLSKLVADEPKARLLVFASPAITAYEDEYGQLRSGQARQILNALNASPLWTLTTNDDGTVVFRLNRERL